MTLPLLGQYLPPGTRVRYDGLQNGGPEYGVVVHCWIDEVQQFYDCRIAFYGNAFPTEAGGEEPYFLRYAATSLTILEEHP